MTPQAIHSHLIKCTYISKIGRIRKSLTDWTVVGFYAHVNSNLGKQDKVEKVRQYMKLNNIPVDVLNEMYHLTRIKLMIRFPESILKTEDDINWDVK